MVQPPQIDRRTGADFYRRLAGDLKEKLGIDAPGNDPQAEALLRVFARFCGLVVRQLNQVPDKNRAVFLNALNLSRIPPAAARAPLTFAPVKQLPSGSTLVQVPAGTRAAAAPAEGESEPVVFETEADLVLTSAELKTVLAVDPNLDRYSDKSVLSLLEAETSGEFAFEAKEPVPHEFYLSCTPIFSRAGIDSLRLRFEVEDLPATGSRMQTVQWSMVSDKEPMSLQPAVDSTDHLTRSGEVIFRQLQKWPEGELFGRKDHWLGCRRVNPLPIPSVKAPAADAEEPPLIRSVMISATWELEETLLDAAAYNTMPLDVSLEFFPFGERPRFGDVLYLSSEAFASPQAMVSLTITLVNPPDSGTDLPIPPVTRQGHPQILWEAWNGDRWMVLDVKDGSESFTKNGVLSFTTLANPVSTEINGQEGFWLRARLIAGHYGREEQIEYVGGEKGYQRIAATLAPPCIASITAAVRSTAGPRRPDGILVCNDLAVEKLSAPGSFRPFRASSTPYPALYLGCAALGEALRTSGNHPLDVYFHVNGTVDRAWIRDDRLPNAPQLLWQYWNGSRWVDAQVRDRTESLTLSGSVRVRTGSDWRPWEQSSVAPGLYWLRVLQVSGTYGCRPRLRRILLNTTPAAQTTTIENELLGSSTGLPGQRFRSARAPILPDLQMEVREPSLPPEEERLRIEHEEGVDAVCDGLHPQEDSEPIWIRWHEVSDFLRSGPSDRHFIIDRQSGEIRFGDGSRGMSPPAAANNVRLRRYRVGGGSRGNVPAGGVSQLRTAVLYVESVSNLEPAAGGRDIETWEALRTRGSRWLRHRDRAVTVEDYEDLAALASPAVAKAKCYPNRDLTRDPGGEVYDTGIVSVVVVPLQPAPRPRPDLGLLRRTRDFLTAHGSRDAVIVVLAPEYVRIHVEAIIAATVAEAGAAVVSACELALRGFLHPLSGGEAGSGWAFGQLPRESDLFAVLEGVPGLEYVRSLRIRAEEERPGQLESRMFLISAGNIRVELEL